MADSQTTYVRPSTSLHPCAQTLTGSVSVTYDGEDAHMSSEDDSTKEYPCLVRVTDGDETKFSTKVSVHCLP